MIFVSYNAELSSARGCPGAIIGRFSSLTKLHYSVLRTRNTDNLFVRPMKLIDLPPVPLSLQNEYRSLIEDVERRAARLSSRLHEHMRCAAGCAACCRRFSVAPLEAALIGEQWQPVSAASPPENRDDSCGFLIENLCSIYECRPLICRTQGLPIAYIDEINERIDVSVCPLNFTGDYQFAHDDLLFLDSFNHRLAELNNRYCSETGISANTRISLEYQRSSR